MKIESSTIKLTVILFVVLAGTMLSFFINKRAEELSFSGSMRQASRLAQAWFDTIAAVKEEKGIFSDTRSNVPNSFLIGNDWSDITTTLGSLEAKETATNPDFAALVVRMMHEAGIREGDQIGVILSGSFPSLSISVLAALQTMELEAVVMSSLGASTYGANQPLATWIDLENWLRDKAGLKYRSAVITMGADQDNGNGLSEEGLVVLKTAAERNNVNLYVPGSVYESVSYKTGIFLDNDIDLLINVGGNMAALGACPHALSIPNGMNYTLKTCSDSLRGIIPRLSEQGIPVLHLLDIKELATRYGIEVAPGKDYKESLYLYQSSESKKLATLLILVCSIIPIGFLRIGKKQR